MCIHVRSQRQNTTHCQTTLPNHTATPHCHPLAPRHRGVSTSTAMSVCTCTPPASGSGVCRMMLS